MQFKFKVYLTTYAKNFAQLLEKTSCGFINLMNRKRKIILRKMQEISIRKFVAVYNTELKNTYIDLFVVCFVRFYIILLILKYHTVY